MKILAVLVACYLIGAIPMGLLAGRLLKGVDIRQFGSGNIGASNILRTLGIGPAITVFVLDTAKGVGAVWLTIAAFQGSFSAGLLQYLVIAGAIAVILGHNFSVFLGFKGGKGVATSLGVIIGFAPIIAAVAFGIWVALVALFRYISVASIIASASVPALMYFSDSLFGRAVPVSYQLCSSLAVIFILIKHQDNLRRLRRGEEPKIGEKVRIEVDKNDQ